MIWILGGGGFSNTIDRERAITYKETKTTNLTTSTFNTLLHGILIAIAVEIQDAVAGNGNCIVHG